MIVLLVPIILIILKAAQHCPDGIVAVRKEYRDMDREEWNRFRTAMLSLQNPSKNNDTLTEWDRLTNLHIIHGHPFHNSKLFLHWHRAFTAALETKLRKIDPKIALPYWDYTHDWQNAEASPIMTEAMGLYVKPGPAGDCRFRRALQSPHCLVRDYRPGNFTRLPSDEFVNLVLTRVPQFERFRDFVEKSIHNPIHVAISGDMNKPEAPNDPIFWLIHGFVDKIWHDWSIIHGSSQLNSTELATILPPFNITAGQVENIASLCYTYQPFSKERQFPPRMMVTGK